MNGSAGSMEVAAGLPAPDMPSDEASRIIARHRRRFSHDDFRVLIALIRKTRSDFARHLATKDGSQDRVQTQAETQRSEVTEPNHPEAS